MLQAEKIKYYSEYTANWKKYIPPIREKYLFVTDIPIIGEAPKRFIKLYEYEHKGKFKRASKKSWPAYIAKVGIKFYPNESITEYLLYRIGEALNLNMAEGKLMIAGNQIRYLSKYFLKKQERLVHGAEILEKHLRDKEFVQQILEEKIESEFFSFKETCEAISEMFPKEKETIIKQLFSMQVFDALIGSQDRHFYNWGVVINLQRKKEAVFSPIYDTARGLFWNLPEEKITQLSSSSKNLKEWIKVYAEKSKPCMGIENKQKVNHYEFIESIIDRNLNLKQTAKKIVKTDNLEKIMTLIDEEFCNLYSKQRCEAIKTCLNFRFERLKKIVK